jgi:alpha-L-fucosidase
MPIHNQQLRRLRQRQVPTWWQDAKLGIFVHWTIASIPAFAPIDVDFHQLIESQRSEAFGWSPYVEWYENSLRFVDSPVSRHHRDVYGDRPYEDFRAEWEAGLDQWDPDAWAKQFASAGARYVVLVSKHADGYCLWPTDVPNPRRRGWNSSRDVVGELGEAVRGVGMRFGLYYSGGMDWRFDDRPMGSMADVLAGIPRGDYPSYAEAQVRELIGRYRPSVLWNDIAWPAPGKQLWPLFEHYYEQVPDGVVNDRWMPWSPLLAATRLKVGRWAINAAIGRQMRREGGLVPPPTPHFDVRSPEYVTFPDIQRKPWECVRGMDQSFGYNAFSREADFIAHDELLWLLTDIVAKGGNLLLNIGPRGADAQIADEQLARLAWLGEWVGPNQSALMETRPWIRPGSSVGGNLNVRYTARGDTVFAFLRHSTGPVVLPDVRATRKSEIETVDGTMLPWKPTSGGISIDLPVGTSGSQPMVVAMRHVEAR